LGARHDDLVALLRALFGDLVGRDARAREQRGHLIGLPLVEPMLQLDATTGRAQEREKCCAHEDRGYFMFLETSKLRLNKCFDMPFSSLLEELSCAHVGSGSRSCSPPRRCWPTG